MLHYHPDRGTVLVCDFQGLQVPEMVKIRPVVVVSPRPRRKSAGLCTVIPLSTTTPNEIMPYHFKVTLDEVLSPKWDAVELWAKCDMIYTFSMARLDRFYCKQDGKRVFYDRHLSDSEMKGILGGMCAYLRL